jgi:hypothetical protein
MSKPGCGSSSDEWYVAARYHPESARQKWLHRER